MPELFWWGVDGDDLITEAAELAPFEAAEAAEAVALVAIVSSFNLLLGHPEIRKFLFQKSFQVLERHETGRLRKCVLGGDMYGKKLWMVQKRNNRPEKR